SDGASLEAFLQWAAAEGGFTLEVDPELLLDPSGQPALVRGSIVDMDLDAALSSVLAGAGLRYKVEGGRLRVIPAEAP
ncbi:MAG: STN domain-containing protein, partial [Acidobacteriota bacterium]